MQYRCKVVCSGMHVKHVFFLSYHYKKEKKKKKALHAFLEVGNNFYTNYWKYIPAEEREVFEQCENGGGKIGEGVCLRKMCTCAWWSWHSVDSMFVNVLAGF